MPLIRCEITINSPVERCFDLARSVDLHVASSAAIGARAAGGRRSGLSKAGDVTTWSARFFGLRFAMTTRLENFARPVHFDDRLVRGVLRKFSHAYRFDPLPDGGCLLTDELRVAAPFRPLGRLVDWLYLKPRMRHLMNRRLASIKAVAEGGGWRRYLPEQEAASPERSSSGSRRPHVELITGRSGPASAATVGTGPPPPPATRET